MNRIPIIERALAKIEVPKECLAGGRVLNCDNRLVFEALPDDSIDLIVTDPPYKDYQSNRPIKHSKVKKIHQADFDLPFFIAQSARVLKPGAHFYCWCDHLTFPAIVGEMRSQRMERINQKSPHFLTYKNMLVWVKNNHGSGDLKGNYAPQHELIIFACKGKQGRPLNGKRPANILDGRKVFNYKYNHGTKKPLEILKKLIAVSSDEGEVVLDPYAGTMGVAEACRALNRYFLMVEKDNHYYTNAKALFTEGKITQ